MTDDPSKNPANPEEDAVESAWDRGLAALYGEDSVAETDDDDADSILATLETRLGASSRVLLPDEDAASGPPSVLSREGSEGGRRIGKYLILGEIARGGMGVILRGRDVDLGRDVAMKVLKSNHANSRTMVQRFVEEAQIGGQLQHPGVVPVYEMGLDAKMRPYFAMKLVNGRTFSAILNERDDPTHERGRHLQTFEQVCQTIAYAHARQVIHRDVKPANVMVGAFGEVQVFDWGFAKVLTRGGIDDERAAIGKGAAPDSPHVETVRSDQPGSQSIAGSVLGTPSYMPPEQACGDVAALDERADVFALGAILCEILTGQPPYVRQPGSNVMEQAQKASLEDAFSRLENCGADRELVDLALRCLQDERDARPRDAGIVAKAIADYLTQAEERTQSAQVATAEARVRASEERKARRLTGALAASIVLLICFTVAIVWSQERDRIEADRQIHSALADARDLSGTNQWPAAQEALRRAELLVDDTRGSDQVHDEVKRFRLRFNQEFEVARIKQADQDLIARLQAIHTQPLSGATEFESHDYAEALRRYGIDVLDLDAEDAAQLIRDKGQSIATEIAFALDDWTERRLTDRRRWNNETIQTLRKLRTLSSLIDDDEWRQRLRDATGSVHRTTLTEMASALTPDERDPRSIGLLATRLRNSHQRDLALTVLRKAFHSYPGDFWINYSLGDALLKSINRNAWYWRGREIDSDRVDEAMQHIWIAVSHQPGNAFLRYRLANLLQLKEQNDEALIHMSEAVDLAPESTTMRIGLANLMIAQGDIEWARKQLAAAFDTTTDSYLVRRLVQTRLDRRDIRSGVPLPTIIENLRRALDTDREERELHRQLAVALYRTADWDAAAAAAQAALELDDGDLDTRLLLARVHLRKGDFDEAVRLLSESTRRGDNDPNLRHLSENAAIYAAISRDLDARLLEDTPPDRNSSVRKNQLMLARVLQRRGAFARAGQIYARTWGDRPPSVLSGRSIGGRTGRNSRGSRPALLRGEPSEVRDGIVSLARAGCGLGEDTDTLGDAARKALRDRALAWFERTLKELGRAVNSRRSDGEAVFTILEGWMYDVRLTCVRDQEWLATFSAEETAAWTAAWTQLADLMDRARK